MHKKHSICIVWPEDVKNKLKGNLFNDSLILKTNMKWFLIIRSITGSGV